MDELAPILTYSEGMYFGELALQNKKPRAGTILTLTDSHYAVVNAETYERLLKKDTATKQEANSSFLRQIPYITNWNPKQVTSML